MFGVGVVTWVCVVTVGNHLKAKGLFLSHEKSILLVPISSWTSVFTDEQRERTDVNPFCFLQRKNKGAPVVDSLEVYT